MCMQKVVALIAVASLLIITLPESSYSQQVRDHRHKPATNQINPPPSVTRDSSKPDRRHGGVGVSLAKNQRVYTDPKTGKKVFRTCGGTGHPC